MAVFSDLLAAEAVQKQLGGRWLRLLWLLRLGLARRLDFFAVGLLLAKQKLPLLHAREKHSACWT